MFKYTKKNHHPYCILHFKKSLVLIDKTFVNTIGETHLNTISRKTENPEVQCCEKKMVDFAGEHLETSHMKITKLHNEGSK